MGRVSAAVLIAAWALIGQVFAQAPDHIYGTSGADITLFTPEQVVAAGAVEAEPTYRFFAHESLAVPDITSDTDVAASGPGYRFMLLAEKSYSQGLQVGPFHTAYEGIINLATAQRQSVRLIITNVHEFENGKTLTTTRTEDLLVVFADGVDIPLGDFSSITSLALGNVKADDGSTITITDTLLAQPVKITVTAEIQTLAPGSGTRAAGKIARMNGERTAVSWWQLRSPLLASGAPVNLSDAVPLVESGTGTAGSAQTASRGDHVHPAAGGSPTPLSDATPKPLGTAAAGSGTSASRDDHVHKRPAEIAENTAGLTAQAAEDVRLKAAIVSVENDLYRPSGNIADGDVLTAVDCSGSPVANCMTEWKAQRGGGGSGGSLPPFDGAGKHLATNADDDAAEWVTPPPDLTDEVGDLTGAIEDLDFLTQDLIAGTPSTGWATVTDASNAGVALFSGAPSCNAARGATYQPSFSTGVAGKYPAVRVKAGFAVANVRIRISGQGTAVDLISGWPLLCTSSDGAFAYYHDDVSGQQLPFGTGVTAVAVQTTGGAHIGTSKYVGDPTKVERWAITGDATGVPISKTLPSITGHGGNALFVNAAATGLEWKAAGGGGAGGGSFAFNQILTSTAVSNVGSVLTTHEFNSEEVYLVRLKVDFLQDMWCVFWPTPFTHSINEDRVCSVDISSEVSLTLSFDAFTCASDAAKKCLRLGSWLTRGSLTAGQVRRFSAWTMTLPGGGGGSSGPSIPSPTAAAKLNHLRVNAAGGAYELASPYSTSAPKPPAASAVVGTAETLARSDHVHALPTIPQGSTDTPEADTANGSAGTSNKWSPSDHSHPITDHDSVTWSNAQVSTLTGGGASGGVTCDGSAGNPTAASCKVLTDAFRRGDYNFFILRVARFDDNQNSEPLHMSGCSLFPGIPSAIFSDDVVADTACTANSGKNSANSFNQYDVFVKFGTDANYIQVRLPNYNSYGVDNVTVTLTGVR